MGPAGYEATGVAVVGCGRWGRNLVRVFESLGTLRAVVDTDRAVAKAMADAYNVPAVELSEVLADADIAAVAIAVPATAHAMVAREALAAGKHTFVEKPLALRVNDAEDLCRRAERAGRVLMWATCCATTPPFAPWRTWCAPGSSGESGTPTRTG